MGKDRREIDNKVLNQLDELKRKSLFRNRKTIESAQASRVVLNGKTFINFCSNDYLGFANHPKIVKAFKRGADKYGVGSGASSLVCGRSKAHLELEEEVAKITGRDKAILFSSGYLANLAIVGSFAQTRKDCVFQDKLNHASMLDASQISRSKLVRYPHLDVSRLGEALSSERTNTKLVLTDSIFSMDGDIAPLREIAELSARHEAMLVVDEAHGFGVFGEHGSGVLRDLNLDQRDAPLMMATFGKALGCAGAFVAGAENNIELMIQKARTYIYSTALAPAVAVAANEGLRLLVSESWRQEHLFALIKRFREGARLTGLPIMDSISHIQPLITGSADKATKLSETLLKQGLLISAIRPPTVPKNSSRLRITLSADHSEEDVDLLLDVLASCCFETGMEDHESA